jgi:hypothetical protein
MDLQMLEERTGLALRTLRYVLDHRLVPGLNIQLASKVAGRPRRFSDDAGFGIACAAVLLQAGVQRKRVHQFLKDLLAITVKDSQGKSERALAALLKSPLPATAHFGDGINIRLTIDKWDSGWIQPSTHAQLTSDYRPRVSVQLDLGRIRDEVQSH